ncbi:hypothetical protein UT300016_07450 [Clostridium senegalense]
MYFYVEKEVINVINNLTKIDVIRKILLYGIKIKVILKVNKQLGGILYGSNF